MSERMILNRIAKLKELEEQKKSLDSQIKALQAEIKQELDSIGTEELKAGDYTVKFTTFVKNTFDSKAFAASHPRIYKRFMKQQEQRRFSIV